MKNKIRPIPTSIRDSLALSRTMMANERTLLAYLRTGMTFMISGAGVIKFIQDGMYIFIIGCILMATGVYFLYKGILRYHQYKNALTPTLSQHLTSKN